MSLPIYDPLLYAQNGQLHLEAPALWEAVIGHFVCQDFGAVGVRPSSVVGTLCYAYWQADELPPDHWAEVVFRTLDSYPFGGPSIRGSTAQATFYVAAVTGNDAQIGKFVNGSYVGGAGVTIPAPALGVRVRLSAEGSVTPIVRLYYNDVVQQTWTDTSGSPLTGTRVALAGSSDITGTPVMAEFRADSISPPAPTLSAAGAIDITSTSVRPRVTVTI